MNSKFVNNFKTALLLSGLTGLILLIGHWLGGPQGVVIAFAFALITNFVGYFFSDKIALASMAAHEVGPEHPLHQIVAQLARRANLPMPRVYVSPQQAPNAFATGRSPKHAAVCATKGLLAVLNDREVAGVMGHELAHVKHRDILIQTLAATIAGAITSLAYMSMYMGGGRSRDDDDGGANPLFGLLLIILAPIATLLIQAAISRSREYNADTVGAEIAGDPRDLASALEKIHNLSSRVPLDVNPAFNSLFIAEPLNAIGNSIGKLVSTHPPLEDRLRNLLGRDVVRRPGLVY